MAGRRTNDAAGQVPSLVLTKIAYLCYLYR